MKKSKIIQLVLVTASLASCNSWMPSWQTTPPDESRSTQDTNNYTNYNYGYNYGYNWYGYYNLNYNYWYWCRPWHYWGCLSPGIAHYGPRHPIVSNVRRHGSISHGGFGHSAIAHGGSGHSAAS